MCLSVPPSFQIQPVTVIRKTIDVQKAIDQIYLEIEEEVIEFSIQKARTESLVGVSSWLRLKPMLFLG
jgi:tRNA (Thr-GGU) A37 N-methylase